MSGQIIHSGVLVSGTRSLTKATLGSNRFILAHSSQRWSFRTRKTWRQEHEAAGHLSPFRGEGGVAGAQLVSGIFTL